MQLLANNLYIHVRYLEKILEMTTDNWLPTKKKSEEHTSELQSRETISYAVFCLKKKKKTQHTKKKKKKNTSVTDAVICINLSTAIDAS